MKLLSTFVAVLALGFALAAGDALAAGKRLGGGQSSGMQRQASPDKPSAAPSQANKGQPAAAAAAAPKRSWMGPLAGLAAGLGLAALASYLGFGEALANAMMFALLAMVVLAAVAYFMRRRALAKQGTAGGLQYAGANPQGGAMNRSAHEVAMPGSGAGANAGSSVGSALAPVGAAAASTNLIPADFDKTGFERSAKVNFIRLQAANDAGDFEDIRNFTTPEMFAEIRAAMSERGDVKQRTDVVSINADVIDVAVEDSRYIVSVRFTGVIREDANAASEGVDELWHMTKPRDGKTGWMLAGIQQNQ